MIPFEFDYMRPDSATEAVTAWQSVTDGGGKALYFGGGTEIVTLAREHKVVADAVVDYKNLPEARIDEDGAWGSALRLNEVIDTGRFGLLARCAAGIADRTVRNSITLGGNICGMLPYREAVLPFLALDGTVASVLPGGERKRPIGDIFSKRMQLEPGELLLSFTVDSALPGALEGYGTHVADRGWGPITAHATGPRGGWYYSRRTREPRLDYPLVTLVLVLLDGQYRLALTGAFGYPLRARAAEEVLNTEGSETVRSMERKTVAALASAALDAEGIAYRDDHRGGDEYRREMTIGAVTEGLIQLTGEVTG